MSERDPAVQAEPEQVWAHLLLATAERRAVILAQLRDDAVIGQQCWMADHVQRVQWLTEQNRWLAGRVEELETLLRARGVPLEYTPPMEATR